MSNANAIVSAIAAKLGEITVANGWQTDIGALVFVWLPVELQQQKLPSLNLRDIAAEWELSARGQEYTKEQGFEVIAMVAAGQETNIYARNAIDDLVQALQNDGDRTWGGLAIETVITGTELIVTQPSKALGGVRVEFYVTSREPVYRGSCN